MGVVLSHDHSGDDSVDYKPLSVCSDEVRVLGGEGGRRKEGKTEW